MAVVSAPLLSFGASGQIGKAQVYATWKGRPYVRRHVIPANPKSTDQTTTRDTFSWLNNVWKVAPADFRLPWTLAAKGQVLTDRNLFIKHNLPILRPLSALTGIIGSPSAKGGLTAAVVNTPGNDLITVTATAPSPLPAGWTILRFIAWAIRQQDPQSGILYDVTTGADTATAWSVVLSGLASAQHYMSGGFFEYQKSSLSTDLAYGPSIGEDVLTT